MLRRAAVALLPVPVLLSLLAGASLAASTQASVVTATQKLAGPYRLVLQVGPPQKMVLRGKLGSGEMMIGGQMASCQMGKATTGMATVAGACNHHLELHVFAKTSGKVVRGAVVSITMTDAATHTTLRVPVMEMRHTGMGSRDYHYGNNIYAAPGRYKVHVGVNKVTTNFTLNLT